MKDILLEFKNQAELDAIIEYNIENGLYFHGVLYSEDKKVAIFKEGDGLTSETWQEQMQNKVDILQEENKLLKQELSITQDAVNELIFNSLNI